MRYSNEIEWPIVILMVYLVVLFFSTAMRTAKKIRSGKADPDKFLGGWTWNVWQNALWYLFMVGWIAYFSPYEKELRELIVDSLEFFLMVFLGVLWAGKLVGALFFKRLA